MALGLLCLTGAINILPGVCLAQEHYIIDSQLEEAVTYFNKHSYNKAIDVLQSVLSEDSLQVQAYELLASSQLKLKLTSLASITSQRGLHFFPNQPDLHWLLAESEFLSGNTLKAKKQYVLLFKKRGEFKESIRFFNNQTLKSRLYEVNMVLFNKAANRQKWDRARGYLKEASVYQPDSALVARNFVLTYVKQKQWENTIVASDSLLQIFPGNATLLRLEAVALYHQKKYKRLLSIYKKLYNTDPENLDVALSYAELLAVNNKISASDHLYRELLKKYPKKRKIYDSLLSISRQDHSLRGQLKVLQKMRGQFPDDPKIVEKMATLYSDLDSTRTERQYYDTLMTMTRDTVKYRMKEAISYQSDDQDSAAYHLVLKLNRQYPDNIIVMNAKGSLEMKLGLWKEALVSYRRLKSLKDNELVETNLGKIFEQLNEADSAMSHYQKAYDRGDTDPDVPYRWSVLLYGRNKQKSFDLVRYALNESLDYLQKKQSDIAGKMKEGKTINSLVNLSSQAKSVPYYNTIAEESFEFITSQFPENKVKPLLSYLLNKYRGSGPLYTMIGEYYLNHHREPEGISLLIKAGRWDPEYKKTQLLLARYYKKMGKIGKAIMYYNKVLVLDPQDHKIFETLIDLNEKNHSLDVLCDRWLLQYRTHPKNNELKQALIEALDKAGRYSEAREILK